MYNDRETPIYENTHEGINYLIYDGHEVDYDILPDPESKPSPTGDTDLPVYKEGWTFSGIDHRRWKVCKLDAAKFYGMNK